MIYVYEAAGICMSFGLKSGGQGGCSACSLIVCHARDVILERRVVCHVIPLSALLITSTYSDGHFTVAVVFHIRVWTDERKDHVLGFCALLVTEKIFIVKVTGICIFIFPILRNISPVSLL